MALATRRDTKIAPEALAFAVSLAAMWVVGASRPNAAMPDLGARGWAPGTLLPIALSPAAVTVVLWSAYGTAGLALVSAIRRRWRPEVGWFWPLLIAGLALLTSPFGSADHVNYLAYGQITLEGGDPWVQSPIGWQGGTDPLASHVEAPWTTQPSVYGPLATLVHAACAWIGNDNLRVAVWAWQVVCVLAWLGVRALLRAHLPQRQHGRIDVLWTFNPLVIGTGVLGAHLDLLAAGLVVVAVWAWGRGGLGWAVVAGLAVAFAESTKFTYAVVAIPVILLGLSRRRDLVGFLGAGLAGAALLHGWAGVASYVQILRSGQTVSLAMPWRPLLEGMLALGLPNGLARTVITVLAAGLAVLLASLFLRMSTPVDERTRVLWVAGMLTAAFAFSASYSLPWYDPLVWAALPATVSAAVAMLATARLTVIAMAYVPGRVTGMTEVVEHVTLGFRRFIAPALVLAVWVAAVRWARGRGWRPL